LIVCSGAVAPDHLAALCGEVVGCGRCPRLVEWRERVPPRAAFATERYWRRPVPGFGDPRASVVVVGLAPAAHGANRTGRMFTGDRSGDWLFRALWRAGFADRPDSRSADDGLELRGIWVTAAVHCAPPDNRPTVAERDACRPYLVRELGLLGAAPVVVALGGFATDAVASVHGLSPRPRFAHLAEHPLPAGRLLLCSYHPSQQNTFTGRLTEEMFDAVFTRAREAAGSLRPAARRAGGAAPRRRSPASASGSPG
jgi:uracil-DNA glycosylase family 4